MKTIPKRETLSPRRRYRVMPGQVMPVAIQRPDEGQQPASAELMDITVSGARILSKVPLRFGEKFVLHLESSSVGPRQVVKSPNCPTYPAGGIGRLKSKSDVSTFAGQTLWM